MIPRLVLCVGLLVCVSAGNAPALSEQPPFAAAPHPVLLAEVREPSAQPSKPVGRETSVTPSPEAAAIMLDRLVELWEKGCLQNFAVLDDAVLDTVVSEMFFYGDSPAAEHILTPQNRPDIFRGAAEIRGTAPDMALHRRDAAEIARFYFGRPAKLADLKGTYLFGNTADGPHMCHARTTDIIADTAGGVLVTGDILCMNDPETETLSRSAALRVQLVQDADAPLGWVVQSVEVNESSAAGDTAKAAVNVLRAGELPAGTQYESCVLTAEPQTTIALRATRPVFDVALLGLEYEGVDDTGKMRFKTQVLHSLPSLSPDVPLVVAMGFLGGMPAYGLVWREADGTVHRFAVQENGMDGSVELIEF